MAEAAKEEAKCTFVCTSQDAGRQLEGETARQQSGREVSWCGREAIAGRPHGRGGRV